MLWQELIERWELLFLFLKQHNLTREIMVMVEYLKANIRQRRLMIGQQNHDEAKQKEFRKQVWPQP